MTTKEIDTDADERPVVVGVTGPRDNDAALRFAADEARRLGVGVSIVHAVHGRRPVDEALEMFRSRYGDVEATALVRHGHPVKVLTELSSSARMVVLQHRELSSLHRIFTGSTLMGVAAHAACPVTSVPAAWTPLQTPGPVTVGLHEDGLPTAVLAEAFGEAATRGCSLRVARAWNLDPLYEDVIVPDDDAWRGRVEAVIRAQLEQLSPEHAAVPLEVEVRHQWPADLLVELAATSDLLVVGRHRHHALAAHRIGSVARALLKSATCPMMVVPV